jgi:hypothetical protein
VRQRRDHYNDHYRDGSRHRSGRSGGRDTTWWWVIGIIVGLALFGGHGFAGGSGGSDHSPSHRSTVCTEYFKGGC